MTLNTESQQKIAREAAKAILEIPVLNEYMIPEMSSIILSAIERATEQRKPGSNDAIWEAQLQRSEQQKRTDELVAMTNAACRSEQQEWTVGDNSDSNVYCGSTIVGVAHSHWQAVEFKNAHNAALTAERQRGDGWRKVADTQTEAVEAERQRREQAERIYTRCPACGNDTLTNNEGHLLCTWHVCPNPTAIESLPKQLLSALAAIEEHNNKYKTVGTGNETWLIKNVDLSLLHKHDDEVRKPIVDALEQICHGGGSIHESNIKIAADALAKVNIIK